MYVDQKAKRLPARLLDATIDLGNSYGLCPTRII